MIRTNPARHEISFLFIHSSIASVGTPLMMFLENRSSTNAPSINKPPGRKNRRLVWQNHRSAIYHQRTTVPICFIKTCPSHDGQELIKHINSPLFRVSKRSWRRNIMLVLAGIVHLSPPYRYQYLVSYPVRVLLPAKVFPHHCCIFSTGLTLDSSGNILIASKERLGKEKSGSEVDFFLHQRDE